MISKTEVFKVIEQQGFRTEQLSDVRWRLIHPKPGNSLEMVYNPKKKEFFVQIAVIRY